MAIERQTWDIEVLRYGRRPSSFVNSHAQEDRLNHVDECGVATDSACKNTLLTHQSVGAILQPHNALCAPSHHQHMASKPKIASIPVAHRKDQLATSNARAIKI